MNLHALRIFTHVARLGGITVAANELLLSQPAVTIQIRNLENEVGAKLLEGKGRGIQLTKEGAYLYEQGMRLFQLESQIEDKFQSLLKKDGKVKIASSYISTNYILPPILASYKSQNPHVEFFVSLGNVKSVEQRVLNFEVDFGFVVQSNIGHEDLHFEKVSSVPFWFIVHASHPLANQTVAITELTKEPFIYRERGSSTRDLLEAVFYANNSPLPQLAVEIQGVLESIKIVEAGYGMTLAPSLSVLESIENGKLARVFVEKVEIEQNLYICTRKTDTEEHPFIQFLKMSMADKF